MANEDKVKILEELKKLHSNAIYKRTRDILSNEILKIESEIAATKTFSETVSQPVPKVSRVVTELSEFAFDESEKFVKIFLPFDSTTISEENVHLEVNENSLNLNIQGDTKDYRFNVRNLLKAVDVSKSFKKVKPDFVNIYLKKVKEGEKWNYLTSTEKHLKEQKKAALKADDNDEIKDDPMGGLMKVMKQMYDSGDSEMKRNIAKAWTEGQEKTRGNPMF